MHRPYQIIKKHEADFRVRYKFRSKEEGGRQSMPFQGIRSDFSYADTPHDQAYMIWPEFEDEQGQVILENDRPVPESGTARMWIINPDRRKIHQEKIRIGTKGFFREGVITADCEVIELLDLLINPII
jgi:hypothetical protein